MYKTSERTLKKWRKESIIIDNDLSMFGDRNFLPSTDALYDKVIDKLNKRILTLTQELIDNHLLNK